jgi:hypothetical protein
MSPRACQPATRVCAVLAIAVIAALTAAAPRAQAAAADSAPTANSPTAANSPTTANPPPATDRIPFNTPQLTADPSTPPILAPFINPRLPADPSESGDPSPSANPSRSANRSRSANPAAASGTPPIADAAPSADVSTADDIRDIRGPKHIFPLWLLLAWLAGTAALAIAGYALWRRMHRPPPPRKLELFEIALQRIEESRTLMQPASVREFSIAISDIVRGYIEDGFDITATHRTTEEFLHDLLDTSNEALAAHRNLLAEFLYRCDEAKFAGAELSMPIMELLHRSARTFVIESSKPLPAATLQRVSA